MAYTVTTLPYTILDRLTQIHGYLLGKMSKICVEEIVMVTSLAKLKSIHSMYVGRLYVLYVQLCMHVLSPSLKFLVHDT